jgi:hypothetical protein
MGASASALVNSMGQSFLAERIQDVPDVFFSQIGSKSVAHGRFKPPMRAPSGQPIKLDQDFYTRGENLAFQIDAPKSMMPGRKPLSGWARAKFGG